MIRTFVLVALVLFAVPSGLYSQIMFFHAIDSTAFPLVSAKVMYLDELGDITQPTVFNSRVTENIRWRDIQKIECDSPTVRPYSVTVWWDATSTSSAINSGFQLNKMTIVELIRALPRGSEFRLIVAQNSPVWNPRGGNRLVVTLLDFTTNLTRAEWVVQRMWPGYSRPEEFVVPPPDTLPRPHPDSSRHIHVSFDLGFGRPGYSGGNLVHYGRFIHWFTFRSGTATPAEDSAVRKFGGVIVDSVNEMQDATRKIPGLLESTKRFNYCNIFWLGEPPCTSTRVRVDLRWERLWATSYYHTPEDETPGVEVFPKAMSVGGRPPRATFDTTIWVHNRSEPLHVDDIVSDNPLFTVEPRTFFLNPFEKKAIRIRFSPVDSSYEFATLQFMRDSCTFSYFVSGGYPGIRPRVPSLRLVRPNGGEVFVAGSTAEIWWAGMSPLDSVSLDFSADSGSTWEPIIDKVSGRRHFWTVPNVVSDLCLVRVRHGGTRYEGTDTVNILRRHDAAVTGVAWSPNGQNLATASEDNTARVWDRFGKPWWTFRGHIGAVTGLGWSRDAKALASGGHDEIIRVWEPNGTPVDTIIRMRGRPTWVSWHPDGKRIASVAGGRVRIVDLDSGRVIDSVGLNVNVVRYSRSGDFYATGHQNGSVMVYESRGNRLDRTINGHSSAVQSLAWSPDGRRIVSQSRRFLRFNSPIDGEISLVIDSADVLGRGVGFTCVTFSPDGTKVLAGSTDSLLRVFDAFDGAVLRTLRGHGASITAVDWSSDGQRFASCSPDRTARIWLADIPPLQSDMSDNVFSIVAPRPDARDVEMGEALVGTQRDSMVQAYVRNLGSYVFRVDSIVISGTNAGDFVLGRIRPPFLVQPGRGVDVEFLFRPSAPGRRTADLTIFTQAGLVRGTIGGQGIERAFELLTDRIDMGKVELGLSKDSLRIPIGYNILQRRVEVTALRFETSDSSAFSLRGQLVRYSLSPGDTLFVDVGFTPLRLGGHLSRLMFNETGNPLRRPVVCVGEGVTEESLALVSATSDTRFNRCTGELADTVNITNLGRQAVTIRSVSVSGPDSALVQIERVSLPFNLSTGGTSRFVLRLRPNGERQYSYSLVLLAGNQRDTLVQTGFRKEVHFGTWTVQQDTLDLGEHCPGAIIPFTLNLEKTGTATIGLDVSSEDRSVQPRPVVLTGPGVSVESLEIVDRGAPDRDTVLIPCVIADQECNVRDTVQIRYLVRGTSIQVTVPAILQSAGSPGQALVLIGNRSKREVSITRIESQSPFAVDTTAVPARIAAGDTLVLRGLSQALAEGSYRTSVRVWAEPCDVQFQADVLIDVTRPELTISVADDSGAVGQRRMLDIRARRSPGSWDGPDTVSGVLVFNETVLEPESGPPAPSGLAGQMPFTITGLRANADAHAHLPMRVALGNSSETELTASVSMPGLAVRSSTGRFHVLGLCRDGGLRLIQPGESLAMQVAVEAEALRVSARLIEEGIHSAALYDVAGSLIGRKSGWLMPGQAEWVFPSGELAAGVYVLTIETPTTMQSHTIHHVGR